MRSLTSLAVLALSLTTSTVLAEEEGLKIEKTHSVECTRRTADGDKIDVHYRGTLAADGTQFDASYLRGIPFTFTLGKKMVIRGWEEGLKDMCVGDKRTLTIPPELGYGERAVGPIPAGSTLVFETELLNIHGVKPEKKEEEKKEEEVKKEEVKKEKKRDEPEKKEEAKTEDKNEL